MDSFVKVCTTYNLPNFVPTGEQGYVLHVDKKLPSSGYAENLKLIN